jgi:hypothetical protein
MQSRSPKASSTSEDGAQEARSAGGATRTQGEARSAAGATGIKEEARSAGGAKGIKNTLNAVLLILHFFGLGAGFVAGFGTFLVQTVINKSPAADAPVLARVQRPLTLFGDAGLAILWATGLLMVYSRWHGLSSLPSPFWWKFACVIALTAMVGVIHMTEARARRGDVVAIGRLPLFRRLATTFLLLALVFAVIAFS